MARYDDSDSVMMSRGEDVAVRDMPDMPNLHALLEDINDTDKHIVALQKQRVEMINQYQNETDKLAAHFEMVVNRPVDPIPVDPIPTAGHPGRY